MASPFKIKEPLTEFSVENQSQFFSDFIAFSDLEFNIGSAIITFGSYASLGELSDLLSKKPEWKLKLSGHTDNVGSDKSNLLLSKNRAEAVKTVLTNRGVDANQIIVKYYGESQPIASNNEEDGRQKNRRVEMLIIKEALGWGLETDETVTKSQPSRNQIISKHSSITTN